MPKLSLHLTKISQNQSKLMEERFFCWAEYWTGEEGGEEKKMDSNSIHQQAPLSVHLIEI